MEAEEQEILDAYERDEWRSVDDVQERALRYQANAATALESMGLVSIALPQGDIQAIREKAAKSGVSHQALMANVLHLYVQGMLVEKQSST